MGFLERDKDSRKKKSRRKKNRAKDTPDPSSTYDWTKGSNLGPSTFTMFEVKQPDSIEIVKEEELCKDEEDDPITFNARHEVQRGESLWKIARKYFPHKNDSQIATKVKEIRVENNLRSEVIHTGQVLKIPHNNKEKIEEIEYQHAGNLIDFGPLNQAIVENASINQQAKSQNLDLKSEYLKDMTEEQFKEQFLKEHHKYWHFISHGKGKDGKKNINDVFMPYIITQERFKGQKQGTSDGIITAYDINKLPLQDVLLVFTNACETAINKGRGDYHDENVNEQDIVGRAFIEAGAQNTISSTYKLDDPAAKDFGILFYKNLFKGGNAGEIAAILRETKIQMMKAKNKKGEALYSNKDWATYQHLNEKFTKKDFTIHESDADALKELRKKINLNEAIVETKKLSEDEYLVKILTSQIFKIVYLKAQYPDEFKRNSIRYESSIKYNEQPNDPNYSQAIKHIFELFWGNIQQSLDSNKIEKIYLNGEDIYNTINLEILYDYKKQKYLIEFLSIQKLY